MGDIRLAVLGTGGMGRMHAGNLLKHPGVTLVGVCGTSLEKAGGMITALGEPATGAEGFTDFSVMLRRAKPTAVVVAIPPFAHDGQTQAAAKKGYHLLLEKPVALTLKDAKSMAAAIEKGGGVAVVGHHMRYGAMVRRVGEAIASGEAGKVTLVQGRWFCNALHGAWWRDLAKSGGQVVEQAIHTYDMACWFARLGAGGGKPVGVSGLMANLTKRDQPGYTVEDTHAAVVAFEGGAMASMCASNAAVPKVWANRVTVVCERMTAEVRSDNEGTLTWGDGKTSEDWWKEGGEPRVEEIGAKVSVYGEVATGFVRSIQAGKVVDPAATVEDAVRSLSVVLGVVKSSEKGGKWVDLG